MISSKRSALLFLVGLLWMQATMATEEPKYEVISSENAFEVRRYAPVLIAETVVEGDMDEASSQGFRRIADFIFGNNQRPDTAQSSKIAMTAPVTVEPMSSKIAMTAPVSIEPAAADTNMQSARTWRIQFVMPSQYTMASIPKPNNSAVTLRELASKQFVVLRYSGLNTLAKVQDKTREALTWAQQKSFKVIGTPQLSRYDPPWTLPMFRRNEIMVEIASP